MYKGIKAFVHMQGLGCISQLLSLESSLLDLELNNNYMISY